MYKKIFFWAPLLGNVGTINAVINSAQSITKYSKSKIYIIDNFGEFEKFKFAFPEIKFLLIFKIGKFFPKTGFFSKFFIYFFSVLSVPHFIYFIIKYRPDLIIANLVGAIPLILRVVFPIKFRLINSIQGYPRFNFIRTLLWKNLYKKSDLIITMSEITKNLIILKTGIPSEKIIKINNPVIKRNLRILSNQDVSNDLNKIFTDNFCIVAVGRLTKQKNYLSLLEVIIKINKRFNNIFLFILGDGELRSDIDNFLKKNSIHNVKLLGFVKNPYKYISKSKLFISTSLWEDPGHALIESAYLNVPILTSNCLSGPKEIFHHKENAFIYDLEKKDDLYDKLIEVLQKYDVPKKFLLQSKKISKQFTLFNYFNSIKNYL